MRIGSWLLVFVVLLSVALTAGAAVLAYLTVRDLVVNSPVAFPTLGSLGSVVTAPTIPPPTASATIAIPTSTAMPVTAAATIASATASNGTAVPATVAPTPAPSQSPTPDLALLVPEFEGL